MNKEVSTIEYARQLIDDCRYPEAIEVLEDIQNNEPDNYEVNYEFGRLDMEMGDYYSAVSNFEEVLKHKQSSILYYNLAEAYQANDEIDKAIGAYLKSITLNEKFPFAYKKLGTLFLARGDNESAVEYFEDYIKSDIPEVEKEAVNKVLARIKK